MKRAFIFAFLAFIASACGEMTQGAPPAVKSKAKVSLVLPQGVSLKPGGVIESGNPKLHAATITGITLSVSASDISIPVTGDIPLDTLMLSLDIPSGLARTFTVAVTTDTAGSFAGSQTVDLAADAIIDVAISVTVVNIPTAPAGVSIASGDGQAVLSWTAVTGADTYNVYYGTAAGVTTANGTKVTGATSGNAITGLTNGTTYYFVVTAVNTAGESLASVEASATPQVPAPGAPTGVSIASGDGQAVLSWTAVTGADTYNVYYGTTAGVTTATGTKVAGATSGAAITGLTNGTAYYFIVTAMNAGGESAVSSEVSAMPQIPVPGVPAGVTVTGGNAQVALSWTAVTGADTYNVYYGTAAGVTTATGTKITGATSGAAITGLTNGTAYYFIVTAMNAGGESAVSSEVSAMPQIPVPGVPAGVTVTGGNAQVALSWTAVTGADTYNVYYRTTAGVTASNGTKVTGATNGGAITGLTNGLTYYFVVTAVNAGGESAVSSEVSATPQVPAPGAPTGITVTGGNAQVALSWTAVGEAASYNVYYGASTGLTTGNGTKITGATSGGLITGLANGTTYYFVVTAVNATGESAASSQVSATPVSSATVTIGVGPIIPTGISATAGDGQAVIGWNVTGGATSYTVYYGTASGVNTSSPTKLTGVTATSATITGLANGTTYYFVVTASDASGESGISSVVSATPQAASPAAPSGLSATAGNGQAAVSWTAVTGAISYNVYYTTYTGVTSANGTKVTGATSGGTITGLSAGTTYFFIVTAVNTGGESAASAQISATTIPAAPTGVTAAGAAGQAVLHWNPVNGASSYNVYYSASSGVTTANGTKVSGLSSGSAITGLAPLTTYYFVVTATGVGGEGAASGEVSAATPSGTPAGVSVSAGNGSATVSWTAVTGATSYNVYYGTAAGVTTANGTKVTGATSGNAITGLTNGTTYYFIVTSVFVGGESLAGTEVSAMPFNPSGAWTAKASMPNALMGLSASSINGTVYAVGGEVYGSNCANTTVNAYNPSTNVWASKAAMLTARSSPGTAVVDGELYAIGGHGAGSYCYVYHNATEMYDPATNTWIAKATMPTARTRLLVAAVNGVIYAIGGTTNLSTASATVEAYDTGANTWSTKASMPVAAWGATSAVVNGIIYVVGGTPDGTAKYSTVQAYNPANNTWTTKAAMPTAREQQSSAVVNGKIYVFGGVNSAGATVATVEVYDPSSDTWSTATSLPAATAYLAATQANGIVYVLGGTSWVPYTTNSTVRAFTPGGYIAPVAGVTATPASTQNTISWTPYTGATSYNVYWSTKDGVSPSTATKIPGVASGYVHTGLTSGTRYYYVVTAVTAGGETTFGDEVSPVQQPLTPAGVSASAGNASASVSWTASAGAVSYNVYYGTSTGVAIGGAGVTKITGATSGGAITGLANGTPYYFVVTAGNAGGESAVSSEVSATPQVPAPAIPGNLGATAGNAQVSLTWTAVTAIPNATITYTVYRSTVSGTVGAAIASAVSPAAYTDATAVNGTTYYYNVAAVDAGGTSAASAQTSATPVAPPATPTGVSASAGNALVTVSWTASTGAVSYNVYYKTTIGVTTANGTKVTGATNGGAITGLTNGTPYYFVVTAVNASGESVVSGEVSATPQVPAPGIPGVLAATPGNNQVGLNWTAVTAIPNATITYTVYRSTVSGTVGAAIASSISVLSYTDTTAANGTTYYYNVAAADAGGTSGASSQASATPQVPTPGIPAGLAATAGNAQVSLTWTAVAAVPNATITYTVYRSTATGTLGASIASSISTVSYTDTTAVNGTTYYYNVASADAGGTSAASSQASATPQVPAPSVPSGLAAIAGNAEVVLTWTAVAAIPNATITYTVYRSTAIGSQGTAIASAVSPATYTDTTAVNGTTYYYRVVAVDAGGSSAASSQVSAVPQVPTPGAPRFAYVANLGSNDVSVYTINPATGALTAGTAVAAGTQPISVTVDPSGRFVYVTNYLSWNVSVYTINQTTGALTAGTAVAAGLSPMSVTVDPSGKFAYVANTNSASVSVYTINQTTGALTAGTAVAAGTGPRSVTVDPSGRFAYVANNTSNDVSVYTINPATGALTAGTAVAAGTYPVSVTIDPFGKFAYVANYSSNNVSVYTIDQTTGALAAVGAAVAAGTNPISVTVDPSGKFAYVANENSNNVSVYTISQTTGALTAVGTAVAAGGGPWSLTVDPSGKFAYVANTFSNNVSVFTISQTTGALTAGTAVAAGTYPRSVAVTAGVAKPLAPGGVSAVAGNASAAVSWTYVAGATSYNVYHRTTTGVTIANGTKVTGATNGAAITGLTNATPYYFVVTAVNATGESVISSEVSATPQVPAPSAPTSPSATAGDTQVTVSWTAPAGTVTIYNIYYGTASGVNIANGTKVTGATSGGAITGLTNGTAYYFVITAVNAGGEGTLSSEVSATPQIPAPSAPIGVSTTVSSGSVALSWTAVSGATSYNIYRSTTSGVLGTLIGTSASASYTDTTAVNGTTYYYTITAVNAGGESVAGTAVSAIPLLIMGGAMQNGGVALNNAATASTVAVSTLAGTALATGTTDATGSAARFGRPYGITTDGTYLFAADQANNTIRKIVISTGVVTTFAGSGVAASTDGTGTGASFNSPTGITTDGTNLFVTDRLGHAIRKVVISTGVVTTVAGSGVAGAADGTGTAASFDNPNGIVTDGANLYIADQVNGSVRKIVIPTGVVTTFATGFTAPRGITTDGTNLYVANSGGNIIQKIVISTGIVTTLAGSGVAGSADGTGTAATFKLPLGITTDGTNLYVVDNNNYTIRQIVISTGVVSTIAGAALTAGSTDGIGSAARFKFPNGITTNGSNLFVADGDNFTIRKIVPLMGGAVPKQLNSGGVVTTFAGSAGMGGTTDATGPSARLAWATGITTDGANLYVADYSNHNIRKIVISTGAVTTLAGGAGTFGSTDATGTSARFYNPYAITTDGTNLYVAEYANSTIRKVVISTGVVTTLAGSAGITGTTDATGTSALFTYPEGITTDGANLYVADSGNSTIRKVVISTGVVTTFAGSAGITGTTDAMGTAARFNWPQGITTDGANLYVVDSGNSTIRKVVISTGVVTTLAGSAGITGTTDATGTSARFTYPEGITTDGANLYVADSGNSTIRKVVISTGAVTTLAGGAGTFGSTDATGTSALFNGPADITTDGTNLYVADTYNYTIREIQ